MKEGEEIPGPGPVPVSGSTSRGEEEGYNQDKLNRICVSQFNGCTGTNLPSGKGEAARDLEKWGGEGDLKGEFMFGDSESAPVCLALPLCGFRP